MCYKILKATEACELGHALKRRICWRQCSRVTDLNKNDPPILCRNFFSKNATDTWPIRIDTLHNTALTPSISCLICTPFFDNEYLEKWGSLQRLNEAVEVAKSDLQHVTDHAQNLNWTYACQQLVLYSESVLNERVAASKRKAEELEAVHFRIQDSVLVDTELSEEMLDFDSPVFYYGPTVTAETSIRELYAPGLATYDASAHPEHIVDWSEVPEGTRRIFVWRFEADDDE